MQELQGEVFLLQNGASIIIKQVNFALLQSDKRNYKMGQLIYYKWGNRYCKVGWVLLSGVSTLQREGNYYKKGQYTFMTLGQVKTHVCLLIRPMRLESGVL